MKKNSKSFLIYLIIFVSILIAVAYLESKAPISSTNVYTTTDLKSDISANPETIDSILFYRDLDIDNAGTAEISHTQNGKKVTSKIEVTNATSFENEIRPIAEDAEIPFNTKKQPKQIPITDFVMPILIAVVIIIVITIFLQRAGGGDAQKSMNFGKSKAKMVVDETGAITFDSVAGLDEEKLELQEVVEFLKEPKSFIDIGARVPKGFLLVGPPGTGKTLLAKAVAGEAGVPFFTISGSDFVEMFVGVGASRVRDLFAQAKKHKPCLIFIDEIDAVGRKRGAGLGGSHDEREQTLNQLLVEMDGFATNEGIIVLAATNRVDILDPALLRPGRFDRKVTVNAPDLKGRLEMLYLHSANKKVSDDVDFKLIAQQTVGFTGADIENLLNEAAILAVRNKQEAFTMNNIREAYIKVSVGTEKKDLLQPHKEKVITAYHEVGHALMQEVLTELDPVHIISIIPTGSAGGYTMHAPTTDYSYNTKTKMLQEITSLLSGRVAEEIFFDDITTGASNDIQRATKIADAIVTKYGMSSLGTVRYGEDEQDVFLGRDISTRRTISSSKRNSIDEEVKTIIDTAHKEAFDIISKYKDVCDTAAKMLLDNDKITGSEFRALFAEGDLPVKESIVDYTDKLDEYDKVAKEKIQEFIKRKNRMKEERVREKIEKLEELKKEYEKNNKK